VSFINALCKFDININKPEENISSYIKLTLGRHIDETEFEFYAKIIAFIHSFEEDLKLENERTSEKHPQFIKESNQDGVLGFVGTINVKNVRKFSKSNLIKCYFFNQENISHFCQELKGAQENWVEKIKFYFFEQQILEELIAVGQSRNHLEALCLQDTLFIEFNKHHKTIEISEIDIWQEYQNYLKAG
jgi:uncharacterized protein YaeQ